jgi:2-C-methyl-D-erythritol 4-phosphate cytidylyltransferase
MKAYCVILAGGVGRRMGGEIPKQFLPVAGKPIIIWTICRVLECREFDGVVVAIHPDWELAFREMLKKAEIESDKIILTHGGKERNDSIQNAISAIHGQGGVGDDDVVVIHDAVRPFVTVDILERSISAAAEYGACVATIPAIDTMLKVEDGVVVSVPQRASLYHGQAPDSARILLLERALASLTQDERRTITGTAQILVVKGIPVKAIAGDTRNMKITTPSDMELAEKYLKEQNL